MYYSYVLRSLKNGILYKGSSSDLSKRLNAHNGGELKYTSKHLPWELMIYEEFATRSEAIKREKWYKTDVGRDHSKMIFQIEVYSFEVQRVSFESRLRKT